MKHRPDAILEAAIALFDEQGVGVSTAKVAAAAGVSNGTLFNYFATKQALLDALYVQLKTEIADAIGEIDSDLPTRDQFARIWSRWFEFASANPTHHRVARLLHESGMASAAALEQTIPKFATAQRVLEDARSGGILIELPDDYLAALMQQQLELAVSAQLDSTHQQLAFDAMWNSIVRSPLHAGTST